MTASYVADNDAALWFPRQDGEVGGLVGWALGSLLLGIAGKPLAWVAAISLCMAGAALLVRYTPLIYPAAWLVRQTRLAGDAWRQRRAGAAGEDGAALPARTPASPILPILSLRNPPHRSRLRSHRMQTALRQRPARRRSRRRTLRPIATPPVTTGKPAKEAQVRPARPVRPAHPRHLPRRNGPGTRHRRDLPAGDHRQHARRLQRAGKGSSRGDQARP